MVIHIYTARLLPDSGPLPPHWLADLPAGKRSELLRSRPARRRESATGLRLLAHGMRALGEEDFRLSEVQFVSGARPRAIGRLDFSISHSVGLVACALNGAPGEPVGLDLERRRPIDLRTLEGYLRTEAGPEALTTDAAFDRWTMLESVVKAAGGAGLVRLKEVEYAPDNGGTARLDDRRWHTRPIDLGQEYSACIATRAHATNPAPEVKVTEVSLAELDPFARRATQPAQ